MQVGNCQFSENNNTDTGSIRKINTMNLDEISTYNDVFQVQRRLSRTYVDTKILYYKLNILYVFSYVLFIINKNIFLLLEQTKRVGWHYWHGTNH